MALESTQLLTEMNTKNVPGGRGRLVHKAINLTAISEPVFLESGSIDVSEHCGPPQPVARIA
jgi:hypothetical protein